MFLNDVLFSANFVDSNFQLARQVARDQGAPPPTQNVGMKLRGKTRNHAKARGKSASLKQEVMSFDTIESRRGRRYPLPDSSPLMLMPLSRRAPIVRKVQISSEASRGHCEVDV